MNSEHYKLLMTSLFNFHSVMWVLEILTIELFLIALIRKWS